MKKSARASMPSLLFPTLCIVLPVTALAWAGRAAGQLPGNSAPAESHSFGELVDTARARGTDTNVFREAVSGLEAGTVMPPLAFRVGDQTQDDFWARAERMQTVRSEPAGTIHEVNYRDPTIALSCRIELLEFRDFPAVEWVAHFSNEGTAALPLLTDVDAIDLTWGCTGEAFVYRAPGGKETPLDFQFQREPLQTIRMHRASLAMGAGSEGRSSVDWLPFFNLQSGDDGVIAAIGWTGQWYARIERDGEESRLRAGMEGLSLG